MVGLTAWQALKERAHLKPGHKVFIPAGAGGIATFAIQLAKHLGAKVATTTSAGNAELVRSLGGDVVIDYKQQKFDDLLCRRRNVRPQIHETHSSLPSDQAGRPALAAVQTMNQHEEQ